MPKQPRECLGNLHPVSSHGGPLQNGSARSWPGSWHRHRGHTCCYQNKESLHCHRDVPHATPLVQCAFIRTVLLLLISSRKLCCWNKTAFAFHGSSFFLSSFFHFERAPAKQLWSEVKKGHVSMHVCVWLGAGRTLFLPPSSFSNSLLWFFCTRRGQCPLGITTLTPTFDSIVLYKWPKTLFGLKLKKWEAEGKKKKEKDRMEQHEEASVYRLLALVVFICCIFSLSLLLEQLQELNCPG